MKWGLKKWAQSCLLGKPPQKLQFGLGKNSHLNYDEVKETNTVREEVASST